MIHDDHAADRLAGVWLGSVLSDEQLFAERAASPAGNQWQLGLLKAMSDLGRPLRALGGTPHPAWPGGRLFAPPHVDSTAGMKFSAETVGYLNLPIVKWLRQHARLRDTLAKEARRDGPPAVALSYNAGYPEARTGRWLREEFGTPWICIVADYPESTDPLVPRLRRAALDVYSRRQQEWIATASGRVYLSWLLYEQEKRGPKLHLEGGIDAVHPARRAAGDASPRAIMYSGSLSAYAGTDLLLKAFERFGDRRCELWISGRGNLESEVRRGAERDPRIRFFGLVSRERLMDLMSRATAFVNPRPSTLPENRANFPSKLLEYLSWSRPVVSTLTPGIPPHYRSILHTVEDETPEGLATSITECMQASEPDLARTAERIRDFVEGNLLWSQQAARLWNWLESDCGVLRSASS